MGSVPLVLVAAVLGALAASRAAVAFCPSMCQCDDGSLEASCSGARLDSVPILLNPSLRSLHLAHNRIASLRQSVSFYGELRRLDLSHNALHSLGLYHFQPLVHLQRLNVSSNVVSSLEPESFAGLGSLAVLDLSANRLTRLTAGLFAELGQLTDLILSSNKIQTIAAGALDGLASLHTLRLEDNNLAHVPTPVLSAVSASLLSLHLSKNLMESLEGDAFRSLVALRELRLNDNALVRIDPAAFHSLDSLQVLDLSFNRLDGPLASLSDGRLGSLAHLDLSGNMWRSLPAAFLCALPRLESLNVSYMEYLRSIDPDAFRTLAADPAAGNASGSSAADAGVLPLVQLVMTNNALLNYLPRKVLDGMERRLVRLDLSGNALETIDLSGSDWPSLRFLNVAYNPLECNCSLMWLWRKIEAERRHHHHHHDGQQEQQVQQEQPHRDDSLPAFVSPSAAPVEANRNELTVVNVTCNGPPPIAGQPLAQLKVTDLNCALDVPVSLVVVLVVVWSAVSAGLGAAFVYWRRRNRHRLEGRLVMIKSTHPIVDHPYQQHRGPTSPVLSGGIGAPHLKAPAGQRYPFYESTPAVTSGVHAHLPVTRSVSPSPGSAAAAMTQHYGFHQGTVQRSHCDQQPVYQQPFAHQYPQHREHPAQHQVTVSVGDEFAYHSHGTVRRVPVTIV